jgi:hypothetical protein
MTTRAFFRAIVIGCALLAAGFASEGPFEGRGFVGKAQARIGRPLTPMSVAGVARRTTRRTIRRTAVYVAALPGGCRTTVVINGTTLYHCGGTYYQAYGNQYVVVHVD